jgi:hypothetical protein
VEDLHQLVFQKLAHFLRILRTLLFDAQLHFAKNLLRRRDARVSADQQLFELVPDLIIDLRPVEKPRDVAEPALARALERLLGPLVGLLGAFEDAEQRGPPLERLTFKRDSLSAHLNL